MKIKLLSTSRNNSVLLMLFMLLTISLANAAIITSTGSGNWNSTVVNAPWPGGVVPLATDDVKIAAGHTITVTAAASITNLFLIATSSKLVINSGQTLTVAGIFTNSGTTTNGVNGPGNLLFTGTGTFGVLTSSGIRPNVIIGNGISSNTVMVNGNTLIKDLTINTGATLNSNTRALNVTGFFANAGTVAGTSSITTVTGNFTNTGSYTLSTGRILVTVGDFSNAGNIIYTGAGRLYLGGNYINTGTVNLLSSVVYFTGTANQSIQGFTTTGTVNMNKTGGTATFTSNVSAGGLTLYGIGGTLDLGNGLTHTFNGTWTRTNGTLNGGSSLMRIGRSNSGSGGTFNPGTGTVEYYRNGSQTVASVTYNNLTLTGTSAKTITTATTIVNKVLSMEGTATATVAPTYTAASASLQYNITAARTIGAEWVTPFAAAGGVIINGNQLTTINAAKVFNTGVPLTINSGAKLGTGANLGLTFGGDFINNGGTLSAGNSPISITNTMTNQSIAGFITGGLVSMTKTAGTATLTSNVSGGGLTINGVGGTLNLGAGLNHTLIGAVALTNGILNGGSSTLNANATSTAWSVTGGNFAAGTSTVNFGGTAQTLATASTFNNLTFSNSGLKTLTGLPTINGVLSMEGTATVSAAPLYGLAATLQYNTGVARSSGAEWITPFNATGGVTIINTGVVTASAAKSFGPSAPLTIVDDATLSNGGFVISGTTLNAEDGATLLVSGTSTFPVFTTTNLALTSITDYNGTAQTVAVKNYGYLNLSGSGNKVFAGGTTIRQDFSIRDAAVAILLAGSASSTENLYLGGTLQTAVGSWGGTGSVAANQNSTWFGSTTNGVLNVTSSCITGTWLGTTNTDWNTASNWCGGSVPSTATDVIIGVNANQPVITASSSCRNILIKEGGGLSISGSNILQVRGNWTNNGNFTSNVSTVNFNGTTPQTIGGSTVTTFNNVTCSNTTFSLSAAIGITIKNILNVASATAILDLGSFVLTDGGTFSNTGSGKIKTANTTTLPIPTGKTWTNTVLYTALTGGQTIVAGTYNGTPSLGLENTSGTQTASGNITTGGQLNINNGGSPTFDMNGYNLDAKALNVVAPYSVIDMRAGTLTYNSVPSMDGTVRFSGATNGKAFSSGTVEYYGGTQTVTAGNYYKLLFSGITGIYTIGMNLEVSSTFKITNGAVKVKDGFTLSVDDAVIVTSPGTLSFENNASLLQTSFTGANTGNVIVKRNTTPILRYDSTFWSSPTTGTQTLLDFSPLSDDSQFLTYNSVNDVYTSQNPATTVFTKGVGYSIRAPENTSTVTATATPFQFVGVPNNGTFTLPLTTPVGDTGLSLIGNPYPSAMNAEDFINENLYDTDKINNVLEGTLYFWTHNNRLVGNDFSTADYASYNFSGFSAGNSGTGNNEIPTDYIASGQGFFIENVVPGNLKFNNTMREINNNTNFYRTKKVKRTNDLERHRVWLDLKNSSIKSSQILVGYIENASNSYEGGYDSFVFDENLPFLFYSLIGTDKMNIQGRTLPFSQTDNIPLGYRIDLAGSANISINKMDGLFLEDQIIYLEDKDLNIIHDLTQDPYTFTTAIGTFDNRFVLRYTDKTLGNVDFDKTNNQVSISKDKNELKIKSEIEIIKQVTVFDLLGKKVFEKEAVNSTEFRSSAIGFSQQIGIVKVTLANGQVISKKVIF